MAGSSKNSRHYVSVYQWNKARRALKKFRQANDLDAFAADYYQRFPKCPPDPFDRILWYRPDLKRMYNRNSAKHDRANKAIEHNGTMTRLFKVLAIPTFITSPITALGFTDRDASYKNYQDRVLITEIKEALKQQIVGSSWFAIELSRRFSLIHFHALCEHDAFTFGADTKLIYNARDLFKYLIKGIPFNEENLAVYLKAKKLLSPKKHLVHKTGTIRLPYSKKASSSKIQHPKNLNYGVLRRLV